MFPWLLLAAVGLAEAEAWAIIRRPHLNPHPIQDLGPIHTKVAGSEHLGFTSSSVRVCSEEDEPPQIDFCRQAAFFHFYWRSADCIAG